MPPCFIVKAMIRYWDNLSYHKKIFAGMLIAAILPLLVYFFFVTQIFGAYSTSAEEKEARETLQLMDEALLQEFEQIVQGMDGMAKDPAFQEVLSGTQGGVSPALYRQKHMLERQYGAYADMAIYDADGICRIYTGDGTHIKKEQALDWGVLFEAAREPGRIIFRNANLFRGTEKESYVNLARTITGQDGSVNGFVVAAVYKSGFDRMLQEFYPTESGVLHILDDFRKPVYASAPTAEEEAFSAAQSELLKGGPDILQSADGKYKYYHMYEKDLQLHLVFRQSVMARTRMRRTLLVFALIAALVSFLLCLAITKGFSRRFYAPIGRLTDAINKIKDGDYQARIDERYLGKDELGSLSRNVNLMAERLGENTERLLERERELGSANIKMMQAQLNPHFLYNALDTMKWIGKAHDVPEVTTISSGLSGILRSSISKEQLIPLRDELALVDDYARIQQIRFDDKFELVADIPEDLLEVRIPKLILQPTVENAIVHGFESMDNGRILITAEAKETGLEIRVTDNGCGISDDALKRLKENDYVSERAEHYGRGNIGLHHVHAIIRLHYGEAYGLQIESEEGKGTTVIYKLPPVEG